MDRRKFENEVALLLQEPNRDFTKEPITDDEAHAVLVTILSIIDNPNTSDELTKFYKTCVDIIKEHLLIH